MRKTILLSAAAVLMIMTAACSKDEPTHSDVALSITGSIAPRAVDNQWEARDNIGILMLNTGTNTASEKTQYKYTTTSGNGTFAPAEEAETAYFPLDNAAVDVLAYYPYTTTLTAGYKLDVDVTDQSNLPAIDLMAADKVKGVSEKNPKVALTFAHKLSKVVVTVDRNTSAAAIDLAGAKVELKGVATKAVYSLTDDVLTPGAATGVTIPVTLADGILGGTAIVIPAAAGSGVALALTTADGRTFTSPLASTDALAPGTENILRMHLGQEAAELTMNIKPWTPGIDATSTVNVNGITSGGTAGNLTPANGDQLTLGVESLTAVYTYSGSAWSTSTPIYWDDLAEQNHTFTLLYTPAADAVEPNEKDYLFGTANIAFGEPVTATLGHLMAQFEVTLTSADFSDALLNAATVELQSVLPVSGINAATGAVTTGTAVKKTMNGTDTDAIHSLTLAPQTFAAGATVAIVTLDGHTYTVSAPATGLALPAGQKTTLAVTIGKSDVTLQVSVAGWADGKLHTGTGDYND